MTNDFRHDAYVNNPSKINVNLNQAFNSSILKKDTSRFIVRSTLIYLGLLVLDFLFNSTRGDVGRFNWINYVPITLYYVFILFNNRVLLKPLVIDKKNYLLYIFCFLPSLVLFSLFYDWVVPTSNYSRTLVYVILSNTYFTFIGSATFLGWSYFKEKNNLLRVNSLQRETELKQLKAQLNPHFLFNSLNNIYSYNLENNKHGNDLILKLSSLMRFMVEASDRDKILLTEELEFIENYISFEKERLGHRCEISFNKEVNHIDTETPPLILFPFIENAFKHGTIGLSKSKIEISIAVANGQLTLVVNNSIKESGINSTKTGLSNIQKRLELLYPDKHRLTINRDAENFSINLKIQLK